MAVETIILNAAYIGLVISTFMRTLTRMRVVLVCAAVGFVAFGFFSSNVSMVLWNTATGCLHGVRIIRELVARRSVHLTSSEEAIRLGFFPEMPRFDFHLVWTLGNEIEITDDVLISAGERPDSISFIVEGSVEVRDGDRRLSVLGRGSLIGEMSFVSGEPAAVDVRAMGTVVLRQWQQRDLATLDHLRPAAARAIRDYISSDLVAKARG